MRSWTNSGSYLSGRVTCQASQSGSPGLTSHAGGGSHPIWVSVEQNYGPLAGGVDPTEGFIVHFSGRPIGYIQRYLIDEHPGLA